VPSALLRACGSFGCPNHQPCPTHGRRTRVKQWDDRRGTASSRGYGSKWGRQRALFISEQFRLSVPRAGLCGARLPGAPRTDDSECARLGLIVAGLVADHIVPVTGPNDPTFWNLDALQFLCARCDAVKRQRESRGGGI
jgi:5-methylcytosine-specific restriction protein A